MKVRTDFKTPSELFGSEPYTVVVDVTNVGDAPLSDVRVASQLLPGTTLVTEERSELQELDELFSTRHRLLRELEVQVVRAYDERMYDTSDWFFRLLALGSLLLQGWLSRNPDVPLLYGGVPTWAREAMSVNCLEDAARVERVFIQCLQDTSLVRVCFLSNKERLAELDRRIDERRAELDGEDGPLLQPGDSTSFVFHCRAPRLFRQRSFDCRLAATYQDPKNQTTGSQTVSGTVAFFASPSLIPLGAVLGAMIGAGVRVILQPLDGLASQILATHVAGSCALALVFAITMARTPERKKMITVEDFFGGFLVGALAAMFSDRVIQFLGTLVPSITS